MATVSDLNDLATLWLQACLAALEFTDAGPPDRSYVGPGQPAMDCEQLVVWIQTIGESAFNVGAGAEARSKAINRGGLAKILIQIQIIRCLTAPTVRNSVVIPPTPGALAADAMAVDQDGWALWLGLNTELKHEGGLLHEACSGAERLGWEKLVPQGNFGGWTGGYRVPLNGGLLST